MTLLQCPRQEGKGENGRKRKMSDRLKGNMSARGLQIAEKEGSDREVAAEISRSNSACKSFG